MSSNEKRSLTIDINTSVELIKDWIKKSNESKDVCKRFFVNGELKKRIDIHKLIHETKLLIITRYECIGNEKEVKKFEGLIKLMILLNQSI
jgi:hypothetical protein